MRKNRTFLGLPCHGHFDTVKRLQVSDSWRSWQRVDHSNSWILRICVGGYVRSRTRSVLDSILLKMRMGKVTKTTSILFIIIIIIKYVNRFIYTHIYLIIYIYIICTTLHTNVCIFYMICDMYLSQNYSHLQIVVTLECFTYFYVFVHFELKQDQFVQTNQIVQTRALSDCGNFARALPNSFCLVVSISDGYATPNT